MKRAPELAGFSAQLLKKGFDLAQDCPRMLLKNQTCGSEQNAFPAPLE